ncbi:MAG: DUF3467 domain-containing protein [Phycisphaeraceae bacterium]
MSDKFDPNAQTLGGTAAAAQQLQIDVDDEGVPVTYGKLVRVGASAEEITLDVAGPLKQTAATRASMKVETRIILNPWAAKRLAIALGQTIQKYEEVYGELEIDERKRMKK